MKLNILILLFFSILLVGCTSVKGVKPIYPPLTQNKLLPNDLSCDVPIVNSLSPTFRWKGLNEAEAYDFAIWNAIESRMTYVTQTSRLNYTPGTQIYYREGLQESSHKPDIELLPFKPYYWSVKVSGADDWSKFNWSAGSATQKNSLFLFETPFGDKK